MTRIVHENGTDELTKAKYWVSALIKAYILDIHQCMTWFVIAMVTYTTKLVFLFLHTTVHGDCQL